jgi:hypothetical protein
MGIQIGPSNKSPPALAKTAEAAGPQQRKHGAARHSHLVGTLLNGQHCCRSGRRSLLRYKRGEGTNLVIEFGALALELGGSGVDLGGEFATGNQPQGRHFVFHDEYEGGECASSQNPGPPGFA